MKRPFLYDPIKYLKGKGVTVRLGLPQDGKRKIEVCFEKGRYWETKKVQGIYKRVEQSYNLIMMQLDVDKGMPPRSVESLLAKGLIRIVYDDQGKRRYALTERGKKAIQANNPQNP
ncbi:hypothetical protein [Halodesulfovibrio sp. MK-HDV]|uniref:hypothetical protein n=1 Tax=Halodesulfovibrio sp. MK-HDV TaxID=2599925 RepID=UPI00137204DD|nr:hypothetical protein [Halodesulfovibrio sp. MK-HDV]KAF1073911.1 hypothetical protein MKHDV_03251 [Halodesulfovibrio sp. MK-HDV]